MFKLLFVYVLSYVLVDSNAGVVSFITPCKYDDKACVHASAQAAVPHIVDGLPSLGVEALDPLVLDDAKADDEQLKLAFRNLKVTGLKKCKFVNIEFVTETTLAFDVECPIQATGKYNVAGKLFVIPIEGDGDLIIKSDRIKLTVKAELEKIDGADGKKHFHIKSLEKSYDAIDPVQFQLDNLFYGNEEKAKPVRTILNASWKELIHGIGKPIIHQLIDKAEVVINEFLAAVPIDELLL